MITESAQQVGLQGHGVDWFADRIGMSVSWVHSNIKTIQHNKIGNRLRFTEADVVAFWDAHRRLPSGKAVEKEVDTALLVTTKRARALKKAGGR